jgi:hypothetical protein
MSAVFLTVRALLSKTAVTTLTSTRIQPHPLKQTTLLPAIAVAMSAEAEELLLHGASQYPEASVQIHCIAGTATDAIKLGETVKTSLRDVYFSDSPPVGASFVKDAADFTDFSDDLTTHRRVMTYSVRWR